MLIKIQEPHSPAPSIKGKALWSLGFRPFYLLASILSLLAIPLWLGMNQGLIQPGKALSGMTWHAHEMLFAYAVAVIAGFLLTAVPNWSGQATPRGRALASLVLLWLAARLLLPWAPLTLSAVIDLAFLPTLAWCIRRSLKAGNNRNNDFIPWILLALAAFNLAFYLAQMAFLPLDPMLPLLAVLNLITVLEVIIAGRVLPMFTRNAAPGVRQTRHPWLERWIPAMTFAASMANLLPLNGVILALMNLLLASLHLKRWLGWGPFSCWNKPLLWVLHLGYLCIALGFALSAGAALEWLPWMAALHVFAIGALGCLTMGMMTRSTLGHTGRMLRTDQLESTIYTAMLLAALLRIIPLCIPASGNYLYWLWAAATFWCLSFILFLLRYSRFLINRRTDGKPG
jgi:uncharacterized protein involved in response to NO